MSMSFLFEDEFSCEQMHVKQLRDMLTNWYLSTKPLSENCLVSAALEL